MTSKNKNDKITICVIDSMIDMKCEGINMKKLSVIPDFSSEEALIFKKNNGHGNAVCSLIHDKNNNAEIILFPVDRSDSPNKITRILRFIQEKHLSRIVNISLGFFKYTDSIREMEETCNELLKNGIFIVAAQPQENVYPAGFKSVIGVSTDKSVENMILRYINGQVRIWIKHELKTLWWRHNYVIKEYGESFATAEVTAMLAECIYKSEYENTTIKEMWQQIKEIYQFDIFLYKYK
jgi:hypothetical protein